MSEIEITLPTVQYGNVKIRATPEEWGTTLDSPHSVGVMAATFLNLFTQGFKIGSAMDVVAPSGAVKAPLAALQPEADHPVDPVDKAAQIVAEGLGGATEIDDEPHPATLPTDEPPTKAAPWEAEVATPKKPWETGHAVPAESVKPVITEDW